MSMSKKFTRLSLLLPLLAVLALQATAQNTALSFSEGTQQQVTFGIDVIPTNQAISVELWAYIPSTGLTPGDNLEHDLITEGSNGANFALGYYGDPTAGNHHISAGGLWPDVGVDIPLDQWFHIALTGDMNLGNADVYLNGVQVGHLGPGNYTFT